jgi:hypothetical protein
MSDKPMTFEEWERENFPDLKLAWIAAMQAGKGAAWFNSTIQKVLVGKTIDYGFPAVSALLY